VANLTGTAAKGLNRVLRNRGTVNYTGTALFYNLGVASTATIENEAGATFITDGEGDFRRSSGGTNAFNNAGVFIKRGAGTTTNFESGVPFDNTGAVTLGTGTLQFSGGFTQDGILAGSGTVISSVTNNGTLRPDATPGGLTIQGNYTQAAAGRLELRLAGNDLVLGHRSFRVTGAATLNGALDVALVSPFAEPQNALLTVMSFDSRTGDFTAVTGLTNNFGYTFSRAFTATTLDLTVTAAGDVPAPLATDFAHWIAAAGASAGAGDQLAPGDDPDRDGVVNFLEYAGGTDAFDAGSFPVITPFVHEENGAGYPALSFRQRTDTAALTYLIEESTDLSLWTPVKETRELSRLPVVGLPMVEIRTAVLPAPVPGAPRYLRLRVAAE
jgi:hypothetical protein